MYTRVLKESRCLQRTRSLEGNGFFVGVFFRQMLFKQYQAQNMRDAVFYPSKNLSISVILNQQARAICQFIVVAAIESQVVVSQIIVVI